MKIEPHQTSTTKIAEVLSESIIIVSIEDGLNLMADIYYQGFDALILHEKNITPKFFDLKTGIAGESFRSFQTTVCV